jgi:hypothetical protein
MKHRWLKWAAICEMKHRRLKWKIDDWNKTEIICAKQRWLKWITGDWHYKTYGWNKKKMDDWPETWLNEDHDAYTKQRRLERTRGWANVQKYQIEPQTLLYITPEYKCACAYKPIEQFCDCCWPYDVPERLFYKLILNYCRTTPHNSTGYPLLKNWCFLCVVRADPI